MTITAEQIPPEVWKELIHCVRRVTGAEITPTMAGDIAAATLNAWPKSSVGRGAPHGGHIVIMRDSLILPLPKENSNADR